MQSFAEWLQTTRFSQVLGEILWIVPALQSLHIIAAALVFSAAVMITIRLFRSRDQRVSVPRTAQRFVPWIWGGLIALTLTGILQTTAEPTRALLSWVFQVKMGLVVLTIGLTVYFQAQVMRNAIEWNVLDTGQAAVKLRAAVSVALWCAILICARWIAYVDA